MKQNICELDTMIFFREALEAHEFMLLPVMASAVVECRTAYKELKTLNEDRSEEHTSELQSLRLSRMPSSA